MEEICSASDEPACDPEYKYRTINGECNNLGYVNHMNVNFGAEGGLVLIFLINFRRSSIMRGFHLKF